MKKLILCALLSIVSWAQYIDGATVSIGKSKDKIDIYRVGVRKSFNSKWLANKTGYLSGYWELSLNYWKKKHYSSNLGIALSPVFAYYLDYGNFKPFVEAGIGVSYFKNTTIATRDISSHFLFEDRIGIGFIYKNFEFSYRYMHYSNAGLVKPNRGIDIFIVSFSYRF